MRTINVKGLLLVLLGSLFTSCVRRETSHREMTDLLAKARLTYDRSDNFYASSAQEKYYDSLIHSTVSGQDKMRFSYGKARALIALGEEEEAITVLEAEVGKIDRDGIQGMDKLKSLLALAYLRAGERVNCVMNHSAETCILPIQGAGIHKIATGSRNAVGAYLQLLEKNPDNLEYRWLLNIAYMTLGEYPERVPTKWLIPALDRSAFLGASASLVKPFNDMAGPLALHVNNMAG